MKIFNVTLLLLVGGCHYGDIWLVERVDGGAGSAPSTATRVDAGFVTNDSADSADGRHQ